MFPTAVDFLVGYWNKCCLWEIWNSFFTLLHQKQNDCHLRIFYQSYEDLLQVSLWSTSIQTMHQFQLCLFFVFCDPYVLAWFNKIITSLQMCYSFIYHSVRTVSNFVIIKISKSNIIISLSKYLWKVSLMFSILFALEFGARQLILPKMVSHFRCLPVATGCSELYQIFFVFLPFFGPR